MAGLGPHNIGLAKRLASDDDGITEQTGREIKFCSCRSAELQIHSRLWGEVSIGQPFWGEDV